jgi:aminopeptidase N
MMRPYFFLVLLTLGTLSPLDAQKVDVYSRPERAERSRDYDVLHYRIELRFDEEARSYWGDTTITISALENGFATCVLDAETFVVDKVVDASSRSLEFEQTKGRLAVHLTEPINYREKVSFTVSYSAINVDVEADNYGLSASYDLGLDFEEETTCCPRVIKTASWPEGARHWFPSYDHPNDRATQEVLATVREDYKVLSNGKLVGVTDGPEPGTKTWHWSQEQTHPTYLFVLVAGPYVVIEDSLGDLPINYWVYEGDKDNAMRSFWKTPKIIEFFNEEFGYEYPWAKYDQITVHGHGGGMESTTATVLGRGTIHDERAEQDFPSHSLVAHEAAHMWWGNLVTYRAWKETWVSESFATYSEYLFSKHDLGEDEGAFNLLMKKQSYLREAHNRYMRPVVFDQWRYPNDNFDSHTYPKGAVILNMLRWIMGDDNFRHALSHFLHEHAFQPVDTYDFIKAVKEATGQNIEWFIEQWILRPGHPVFEVSYDWDAGRKKLTLTIRQTQDTSGDIPIYTTPVSIGVHTAEGTTSQQFWLKKQEEVLELDVDQKPLLVRFDNGNYLLKEWTFEKSTDELLYQLANDDVIGRMWAASELVKHDDDSRTGGALIAAARDDPFWAVRRAAVEAVGQVDGKGQIAFLKEKALDESSKVRVAALGALGNTGDRELVGFFKKRFEADDSYLAQAEALRSIGKTADGSERAFLEAAILMSSPRNVIERGATWSLEQLEKRK